MAIDSIRSRVLHELNELQFDQDSCHYFDASELTVVTGLFDLSIREGTRYRNIDQYLKLGKHVLDLPINLVVATEHHLVADIWRYRVNIGLGDKTFIYTVDLEQSPYFKYLVNINAHYSAGRKPCGLSETKDTALYSLVGWTRYYIMGRVAKMNPFNSAGLVWIDYGIFHLYQSDVHTAQNIFLQILRQCPRDKIGLMLLSETVPSEISNRKSYYAERRCKIAAGFCSGSLGDFTWLAQKFNEEVLINLSSGHPSLDEIILSVIYCENRSRFSPYYGDYHQIFPNHGEFVDNPNIIRNSIVHCRNNNLHMSGIRMLRYLFKSRYTFATADEIDMMNDLLICAWYIDNGRELSKLAAQRMIELYHHVLEQGSHLDIEKYKTNVGFHSLSF